MAILTIHHWDGDQERGVRELRRVTRGPVVIMTYDAEVYSQYWLLRDYMPELVELNRRRTRGKTPLLVRTRPKALRSSKAYDANLRR